jgi:hypothetical protein
MKAKVVAVMAAMVGFAVIAQAQSMIEYSHIATQSASSASSVAGAVNSASQRTAAKVAGANGTNSSPKVWEAKTPQGSQPPAKPVPSAVFIMANGERFETRNYLLTADSVKVQQGGAERTIPIGQVNVPATVAANHQRGIELQVPANNSQITISF